MKTAGASKSGSCGFCYVYVGFRQQTDKLLFGGESPLTMRYERWVINQHPLGPATISCYETTEFVGL